ncbi:MAG: putative ABC transporter permease [Clostridiales bacterium]|nr:putative ABC transporter permease [Clostridiales bacterium]
MRYTNAFLSAPPQTVIYEMIAMFFIYSFIGWIWECLYVWVKDGKLYNRGFLTGPILPIYGLGGVGIVAGLGDLRDNVFMLFFSGVILCTALEYITALICEKIFRTKLWDYSGMRFNLKGRICLAASLMWGAAAVLLICSVQPVIEAKIMSVPHDLRLILSSALLTLLAVDTVSSIISIYNLKDKVHEMLDIDAKLRAEFEAIRVFEDMAQERSRKRLEEREEKRMEEEQRSRERLEKLREALGSARRIGGSQKRLLKAMPQLKFTSEEEQEKIRELRERIGRILKKN